jgi:hypothetical protein
MPLICLQNPCVLNEFVWIEQHDPYLKHVIPPMTQYLSFCTHLFQCTLFSISRRMAFHCLK